MPPYRGELFSKVNVYLSEVDWTINHIVRAFNLPTAYNAPGQEDIQFEEGKKKIAIDPKVADVSGYTLQQLEDVVDGWMYFLNGVLKGLRELVGGCIISSQTQLYKWIISPQQLTEFTPIAEYNLWYTREKELYSILEQLKTQFCINVVDYLRSQGSTVITKWDAFIADVESKFKLAKENSDYLSTITDYIEVLHPLNWVYLSFQNL